MDSKINYVENIGYFRKKAKLSILKMCELSSVPISSYNDMAKRNSFSTQVLEKFAYTLNVQVSDLVKSDQVPEPNNDLRKDFDKIKEALGEFEDKHIK
jgi:hypothetical protein